MKLASFHWAKDFFDLCFFKIRRKSDLEIGNVLYSLLTNLVSEKQIRSSALNRTDLFQIVTEKLEENSNECQSNLLGLLINLSSEPSDVFEKYHSKLTEIILKNLKNSIHHHRVLTLLGNILMNYSSIVSYLIEQQTIPWIRQVMAEVESSISWISLKQGLF